ncbi:unnamed protein product [Oikopleura dioica]|uniref:Uncharacterized protein n=1 Tax=Oikopleura dioica TaxID=34765 RepID=E4Y4U6_OIKDI|nr:unnamed protein product [Oikopleura dioica]
MPKFTYKRKNRYQLYRGWKWFGNWTTTEMDKEILISEKMDEAMKNPDSEMTEEEYLETIDCGENCELCKMKKIEKNLKTMKIEKEKTP